MWLIFKELLIAYSENHLFSDSFDLETTLS